MLKELEIDHKQIALIISYLKKKTQKSFIDLNTMKYFLHKFSQGNEAMVEMIFEIISFPKDYINKADLISLIKSYKINSDSSSNKSTGIYYLKILLGDVHNIFDDLNLDSNNITINIFKEIYKLFPEYINESLERIRYIPYMYFMLKCEDKIKEKNCIEILMKKEKNLKSYMDRIQSIEKEFYLVNFDFWVSWFQYAEYTEYADYSHNSYRTEIKTSNMAENNRNKDHVDGKPAMKRDLPKINTTLISDRTGRVLQGLVYFKDYVVLTTKMYRLFKSWFGCNGPDLKRYRIKYISNRIMSQDNDSKLNNYEIEVYPVYIKFYKFEELAKNQKNLDQIINYLGNIANNSHDSRICMNSYPWSRVTKYKEILKSLELSMKVDGNKTRIWMFYQSKFYIVQNEKSLEEDNIVDFAMIVFDSMNNSKWASENLEINENKSIEKKITLDSKVFVGLTNIGNTCYMNSILQQFLNISELKEIVLKSNFDNSINFANKHGVKGLLILEFINILKEKWIEDKKTIAPKKIKEIIGNLNEVFSGQNQQDAHEFFTFMLDTLHEEINLKPQKEYIQNPETCLGSDEDLADEYWANNLRRNTSFIHALFLGQLKSTLKCQSCSNEKVSYETFSSISLPIPEGEKIVIEIILFRLPFTYKVYYKNLNQKFDTITDIDAMDNDTHNKLNKLRQQSINASVDFSNIEESMYATNKSYQANPINMNMNNFDINQSILIQAKNLRYQDNNHLNASEMSLIDPDILLSNENQNFKNNFVKGGKNENIYMSRMITNIPIRIKIEIERKDKVERIISMLKRHYDLELEQANSFTDYFIYFQGGFIDKNLTVDSCFQNNSVINVYEQLNTNGTLKLNNNKGTRESDAYPVMTNENINDKKLLCQNESVEYQAQIRHRYQSSNFCSLFPEFISFNKLNTFFDFVFLSSNNAMDSIYLYNYIWSKYEYLFTNPSRIDTNLWWRTGKSLNKNTNNSGLSLNYYNNKTKLNTIKAFYAPFVIKILNNDNLSCITCPWFKFCSGCVLDPVQVDRLTIASRHIIMVEWCSEIVQKEINQTNLQLILNHNSLRPFEEQITKKENSKQNLVTIDDCFGLFTEKEDLGEDKLFCKNCHEHTSWFKQYEIERLPPYLTIAFKRFRYTSMYKRKLEKLIDFKLTDLDLNRYYCYRDKKSLELYDLYSVVNHSGSMNSGHYTTAIKHDNKWVKYDDSRAFEIEENTLRSSYAYILIYKLKDKNKITSGDYYTLMNNIIFVENDLSCYKQAVVERKKNKAEDTTAKTAKVTNIIQSSKQILSHKNVNLFTEFNSNSKNSQEEINLTNLIFIKGEPVSTQYGRGYVKRIYEFEGVRFVTVKLKIGYAHIK